MVNSDVLISKYGQEEADRIFKIWESLKKLKQDDLLDFAENMAGILVSLKLDHESVCASLVYPFLKNESTCEAAKPLLAGGMVELAAMLERCDKLSQTYSDADGLKEMLIAITKDIRVIIIKIVEVLVFARKNKDNHSAHAKSVFKSIDDIFVPIAARLGLSEIKSELQDLSFYFSKPEEYKQLEEDVHHETRANKRMIDSMVSEIKTILSGNDIECTCYGRVKHISSIYNKLKNKNYTLKNIYDISAVRILVSSVAECYAALGLVHSSFTPVDGRFKDYIASPKPNGYKSLHTTVYYQHEFFEVQIRTYAMHEYAEYGVAAHFLYKEHKKNLGSIDNKLIWIRKLIENKDSVSSEELLEELKTDVYLGEIFVCSPKGKVVKLLENATPIDFAYAIHSDIGNMCVGAKINGNMVPLYTPLSNGDVVEILTSQNSKGPSRDWLKHVVMQTSREKINNFFKKQMKEENIKLGKSMLENYAKSIDVSLSSLMQDRFVSEVLKKNVYSSVDELYASIGYGSITAEKVVRRLMNLKIAEEKSERIARGELPKAPVEVEQKSKILGVEGTLTNYCKFCNPIPGDEIVGYVSRGRGIIIHRKDCEYVSRLPSSRFIKVDWNIRGNSGDFKFNSFVMILAKNTTNIYVDISNALNEIGVKISSLSTQEKNFGEISIRLGIMVKDKDELAKVKNKLSSLSAIFEVH